MPAAAAAAIQDLVARIPLKSLDAAIDNFRKALQEVPQRSPGRHLVDILSCAARACSSEDDKASSFADIALFAAQWAYLCGSGDSPYTRVVEEARRSSHLAPPSVFDLTVKVGEIAGIVKFGWDPYSSLVELAGLALVSSARAAK